MKMQNKYEGCTNSAPVVGFFLLSSSFSEDKTRCCHKDGDYMQCQFRINNKGRQNGFVQRGLFDLQRCHIILKFVFLLSFSTSVKDSNWLLPQCWLFASAVWRLYVHSLSLCDVFADRWWVNLQALRHFFLQAQMFDSSNVISCVEIK